MSTLLLKVAQRSGAGGCRRSDDGEGGEPSGVWNVGGLQLRLWRSTQPGLKQEERVSLCVRAHVHAHVQRSCV